MTQVKICGITNRDDAMAAVDTGADMLGFVLAESRRYVQPATVKEIVAGMPDSVIPVFVFRNQSASEICQVMQGMVRGMIQLHGEEPPDIVTLLPLPVIRQITVANGDTSGDLMARMRRFPAPAYLLDPGGGDGRSFDWNIARLVTAGRIFLAGGLTANNVTEALRVVRPFAVDVSSGVESAPGQKNSEKMRAFVRAVRSFDAESHD